MTAVWNTLLDPPDFPAGAYATLADRIKRLLGTQSDIVFVQAEAVLALEAVAAALGRPGRVALNVVTSGYGVAVGAWLRAAGADVRDVASEPGRPIAVSAVAEALAALPRVDMVVWTHGETSSGVVNPLAELAGMARARGALTVVDAVASAGGHALDLDAIDVAVIGPQKALAGPAGVSVVVCNQNVWPQMNPCFDAGGSLLSLSAIKRDWIDRGRSALPGTPPPLEFWALDAAIARVEGEGLGQVIHRHRVAALAARAALRALGLTLWIEDDDAASHLATTMAIPAGLDADRLVADAPDFAVRLLHAGAPLRGHLLRLDHMGRGATAAGIIANVAGLGRLFRHHRQHADIGAATDAAAAIFDAG